MLPLICDMSSTPTSHDSKYITHNLSPPHDERKGLFKSTLEPIGDANTSRDVLFFLIAFRILNALSVRTFFQPDEYFQSLEPAWELAFGIDSGAWMTWVSYHVLPILRRLTSKIGMEESSTVIHPSCHICWRLLAFIMLVQRLESLPGFSCGFLDCGTESDSSSLCSVRRLLHLAAWGKDLRSGKQNGMGSCM